jgi:hypothetical protein
MTGEDLSEEPRAKWALLEVANLVSERDALQAKLSALEKQEPVGYVYSVATNTGEKSAALPANIPNGVPLFAAPVAPQQEKNWRDHVEQRIRNWRQSTMNRSGDRLALDDCMNQQSIDDLIDYVCDEFAFPKAQPVAQPAEPLTNQQLYNCYIEATNQTLRPQDERLALAFARAIEAAHGIKQGGAA